MLTHTHETIETLGGVEHIEKGFENKV